MKKRSTFYVIAVVAMFFISGISRAQTTAQNTDLMYLQTDDITVEKFQALQNVLKNQAQFSIKEACVPAQVISVRIHQGGTPAQVLNQFKAVASSVDIQSVILKEDYNDEKFLQKCSSARSVN